MKNKTILLGALLASVISIPVQAALYNVQFGGSTFGSNQAPAQTGAGIIGTAGDTWNYVAAGGGYDYNALEGAGLALVNSAGAATTGVIKANDDFVGAFATVDAQLQGTSLANLFQGFIVNNGGPKSFTFSGLAASSPFDLYTYAAGPADGGDRISNFSLFSDFSSFDIVGPNAGGTVLNDPLNYSVLSGTTSSTGTVTVYTRFTAGSEGNINGFQLNVIPEPSSMALIGLGACGLLARRRRIA